MSTASAWALNRQAARSVVVFMGRQAIDPLLPFRDGGHVACVRCAVSHNAADMGMSEHLSKQFDTELESIRSRVLEMGGLVESQIRRAVEGYASGDTALLDDV